MRPKVSAPGWLRVDSTVPMAVGSDVTSTSPAPTLDTNLRAPVPLPSTLMSNIVSWNIGLHERLLGKLEITHRFAGTRFVKLLEAFDRNECTGAALASAVESIILKHLPTLPYDQKSTTASEGEKLQKIWTEVKAHLASLIVEVGENLDAEKHLINCKPEKTETMHAFVGRYQQMMRTVSKSVPLERACEILLVMLR